jgi:hypothetical protein
MTADDHETLADALARARTLAAELERLAQRPGETPLALRLACAHALGAVDQLEEVARPRAKSSRAA